MLRCEVQTLHHISLNLISQRIESISKIPHTHNQTRKRVQKQTNKQTSKIMKLVSSLEIPTQEDSIESPSQFRGGRLAPTTATPARKRSDGRCEAHYDRFGGFHSSRRLLFSPAAAKISWSLKLQFVIAVLLATATAVSLLFDDPPLSMPLLRSANAALAPKEQNRSFRRNPYRSRQSSRMVHSVNSVEPAGEQKAPSPHPPQPFGAAASHQLVATSTNQNSSSSSSANHSSLSGKPVQGWTSWVNLPSPRMGAIALQTDHFLFIVGGSSNDAEVTALRSSSERESESERSEQKDANGPRQEGRTVSVNAFTGKEISRPAGVNASRTSGGTPEKRARAGDPEIDVILFIDLLALFSYVPLQLTGDPVPPIITKAGVAQIGYDLYLCYACDVMRNNTVSGTFLKVQLPPGELWSLDHNPPPQVPVRMLQPSSQRFAASMGEYTIYIPSPTPPPENNPYNVIDALPTPVSTLYLFGGRDADLNPISTVEKFSNGTWSTIPNAVFPKPYCFCSVTEGVYGTEGDIALFITDCHHCQTWESAGDAIVFFPSNNSFISATDPSNPPTPLQWPAEEGIASSNLMGTMLAGLTYSPSAEMPNDPLALLLYDMLDTEQVNFSSYRPTDMQVARTDCAVFSVSGYLMCIGGRAIATGKATSMSEVAQLLPNVYAMPDRTDGVYYTGETPKVVTSGSCGPNTKLMLATDPDCLVMIPYTEIFNCVNPETKIPSSHLTVGPDEEIEMYICATDGTCKLDPTTRVACKGGPMPTDQFSCLWSRCCWETNPAVKGPRCYQTGPATSDNYWTTSWMQTTLISSSQSYNPRPIVLMQPIPDNGETPKRKFPIWLIATMSVIGAVLLTLLVLVLIRFHKQRQQLRKRKAYATNAFFAAFGKAYQVQGLIGQGSYGAVFLAERARDKKLVALKIIPCLDYKQRDRALREFDLLNNLKHPHLILVLDLIINWDSKEQDRDQPFDTISKKSRLAFEPAPPGSELDSNYGTNNNSGGGGSNNGSSNKTSQRQLPSSAGGGALSTSSGDVVDRSSGETSNANSGNKDKPSATNSSASPSKGGKIARTASTPSLASPTRLASTMQRDGGAPSAAALGSTLSATAAGSPSHHEKDSLLKGSDLQDMIPNTNKLPSRFICIATEYFPEGDLTRFVINYPRRGAIFIGDNDPLECVMHYEQVAVDPRVSVNNNNNNNPNSVRFTNGPSIVAAARERERERDSEGYGSLNTLASGTTGGGNNATDANSGNLHTSSSRSWANGPPGGYKNGATAEYNAVAYAGLSGGDPATTKPIPELTILNFSLQICEVLVYMHNLSPPLVHRDLKPDNVLVDKDRVVVTDFGLSSWQTNAETGVGADACVGTLFFTAPEALGGSVTATPSVDCWALGCILYAMCTRRVLPENARVMFSDVDDDDFEAQIREDLSFGYYSTLVVDIILGLLQREPENRLTALQAMAKLKEAIAKSKHVVPSGGAAAATVLDTAGASIRNFLSART